MSWSRPARRASLTLRPELGRHHAGEVADLDRVGEQVLGVRRAHLELAEQPHQLGVDAVQAEVEHRLLAGLAAHLVDVLLGLLHHLLDAGRVDAAVGDQRADRQPRDLAAHRVEARDRDRLGGVVDDHVDAGGGLERADVAALAADQPALHVVGRQRHHGAVVRSWTNSEA
jgi:hypothetical protein